MFPSNILINEIFSWSFQVFHYSTIFSERLFASLLFQIQLFGPIFSQWFLYDKGRWDKRFIFRWSKAGLNLAFFYIDTDCHNKAKESSQSYYLPIANERRDRFLPFLCFIFLVMRQFLTDISHWPFFVSTDMKYFYYSVNFSEFYHYLCCL